MTEMLLRPHGRRAAWLGEARATFALAWPLVLSNLAQTSLTAIDVLLMGRLGAEALAAGALGTNLFFGCTIFGIGVVTATAPMLAQELGRNRHSVRDVRRTVRQGFWVAVAVAVPLWTVLWFAEPIFLALRQEPRIAAEAGVYLRALQWSILPWLWCVVLRAFLAALGRPHWGLAVALAAVPANAVLAWALIYGRLGMPALGLVGAGLATTIVNAAAAVALAAVVLIDRRFRRYRLFGRAWRPDWPRFARVWRLGLPIGATLTFEVAVFNAAAFVLGTFGAEPLAAHTIALQVAALTFMVPLGLAQAATVRVGLAFGAGDPDGVARAGWTALALAVAFMSGTALAIFAVPDALASAFLDPADPASAGVARLAVTFLTFAALFQVVDGAQAVGAGMLRGLGDTRWPMLFAGFGYWGVGATLGIALAFPGGLAGVGVWIGLTTGLAVVAALMVARWSLRERLGLVPPRPS